MLAIRVWFGLGFGGFESVGRSTTPRTGESSISVPAAASSIWDAVAGLVRHKSGQHPRHEPEALAELVMASVAAVSSLTDSDWLLAQVIETILQYQFAGWAFSSKTSVDLCNGATST